MKVRVIDSVMGTGKSSYIMQEMNTNKDQQYIYVTPNKTECDRVATICGFNLTDQPRDKKGQFLDHIQSGCSVAITHKLFSMLNSDDVAVIASLDNIHLIVDETPDVIRKIRIPKADIDVMIEKELISVEEKDGYYQVYLTEDLEQFRGLAQKEMYADALRDKEVFTTNLTDLLISMLPVDIYNSVDSATLLTYNMRNTKMDAYLQFHKIRTEYFSVEGEYPSFYLVDEKRQDGSNWKHLINICDKPKLNEIGKKRGKSYPLTMNWYTSASTQHKEQVRKNTYNFFRNITRTKSEHNMVCVFEDSSKREYKKDTYGTTYESIQSVYGKNNTILIRTAILQSPFLFVGRLTDNMINSLTEEELKKKFCYVPFNTRATNIYSDRTSCAFLVDVQMDKSIASFFDKYGITLDEEQESLNTLIQWIWRSAIRNGEEIDLYIPSARMRGILMRWLGYDQKEIY